MSAVLEFFAEPEGNPYVGLRPFFAEDSLYFYGREQQTAELMEILRRHRFLGVVGSSGSGKSSLVRAGLLPGLLAGFLVDDRDRWRMVQIKPGDAPLANLAAGLVEALTEAKDPPAAAALEREMRESHTAGVLDYLRGRLEKNANLFLLIDQFEEIFAFRGLDNEEDSFSPDFARRKERARRIAEAADFVDLLLSLAEQRELPIYVTLTMRTDFLGDCDLFHGLPEALNRGRYLVPRMTREQLRDAVECPAMLRDARVAPRLLDRVLNELGDRFDRLPVLQHALLRTWDAWERGGCIGPIDLQHFEAVGGLEGALDQDAEAALGGLDIKVVERIFGRLTDTDLSQRRVRSPARITELMAAAGAQREVVQDVVRRFEEGGRSFVHASADGRPEDPRIDISHESLIRQWDRLRDWVDTERRSRDQYKELVLRARKRLQGEVGLLRNPELQRAIDWHAAVKPSEGWARRYAAADDDFAVAAAFLRESFDTHAAEVARQEVQRRWEKGWSRWMVLLMVIVLGSVARRLNFLREGLPVLSLDNLDEYLAGYGSLEALIVLGMALVAAARRLHRWLAYRGVLRAVVAAGGRSPLEVKAATQQREAVEVHGTTYASTLRRIVAWMIDWVLYIPLLSLADRIFEFVFPMKGRAHEDGSSLTMLALCLLFAWLYEVPQLVFSPQATIGMRAMGIFRTDLQGNRMTWASATVLMAYRLLSYLALLGFLPQPFTKRRQTFHDRMAGSVVLRRPQPAHPPP
ncbi:RDD family protein [Variovorax sp. J22R133]|uniref:RDD family protein n=1 Tax=Variovorax brevis TaxID=3053503 RepID=UPI00257669FD|nr:RDD family protein [Variovorax sp. J22R133]MDM0116136.1 RDD family protein [Variovorax sp. J22R133]